jgi:hypothetical protein
MLPKTVITFLLGVLCVCAAPPPYADQTVHVNKGGNDFFGTGTIDAPFLTIQRAMTSITDASQSKVYSVMVGPGTYDNSFSFKPWVSISGVPATSGYEGQTTIGSSAVVSFDAGWIGSTYDVAWFSHLTFNGDANFDIQNVNAQLTFFDCLFNSGASYTGHYSGNVNNIVWDNCLAYGFVQVTDCQYFFFLGGSAVYDGSIMVNSTSAVFPSQTTLLALGGSLGEDLFITSGVGSGGAIGDLQGCSVTGSLTLTGGATMYTATVEGIPQTVTLLGGAQSPSLYTLAFALGYVPSVPANWAGTPPANVQNALDRIAAVLATNFGPIP